MGLELLERDEISRVLFHPRHELSRPGFGSHGQVVRFPIEDQVSLGGRLYTATPETVVILYFHGNGEIAADYDELSQFYRRLGASLLVVDYRGYGQSTGTPRASSLISDAIAVYRQCRDPASSLGLAGRRLFVMGRSLGSAAALAIAEQAGEDLAGLILESGFADTLGLIRRLGGVLPIGADEARDGFGNLARIGTVTVPTLIIHGEEDRIIPFADAEALFQAAAAPDKRLVRIALAGHNDLLFVALPQYFQAIADLLKR
jgi:alpha-beta hydrolase superfamily lysophospholipase